MPVAKKEYKKLHDIKASLSIGKFATSMNMSEKNFGTNENSKKFCGM